MTVGELGRRMSSAEFSDWLAFMQLEKVDRLEAMTIKGVQTVVIIEDSEGN